MVVVVAVLGSDQTDLVSEAGTLADAFDDELHVVHVLDVDMEDREVTTTGDEAQLRLQEIATDRAESAASGLDRESTSVGLVDDRVPNSIIKYADDQDARYIVVGGRKRSPTGKAIFGDKTQSILLNSTRPVVTVMQQHR